MEVFKIFRDSDLGMNGENAKAFTERKACRAIVFDKENKIAIFYSTKNEYHKLPGGGAEKNENLEETLTRELQEEIGCAVENVRELGIIEEYRSKLKLHQISYCFMADLKGEKGTSNLDQGEIDEGFITKWVDLDEAVDLMKNEKQTTEYKRKFIQARDLMFLQEARKVMV